MKFLLFTLPLLLLFSCAKQEEPIIHLTVTQDSSGQIVLTANLEKISPSKVSVAGFSAGSTSNHYIQENQIKTDQITSQQVQLNMDNSPFIPGQTYYFTCFIGTKSGKLIRSLPVAYTLENSSAPCSIVNNTYLVKEWGGTAIISNGSTTNANLTSTSGGGIFQHYTVQFGSATYKFIFRGNPTTQVYTTSGSLTSISSSEIVIQNTSSGAIVDYGENVYVTDNNNGTFTITKCPYLTSDFYYFPSDILLSFKITGNY
jgi:hypothetical protein